MTVETLAIRITTRSAVEMLPGETRGTGSSRARRRRIERAYEAALEGLRANKGRRHTSPKIRICSGTRQRFWSTALCARKSASVGVGATFETAGSSCLSGKRRMPEGRCRRPPGSPRCLRCGAVRPTPNGSPRRGHEAVTLRSRLSKSSTESAVHVKGRAVYALHSVPHLPDPPGGAHGPVHARLSGRPRRLRNHQTVRAPAAGDRARSNGESERGKRWA